MEVACGAKLDFDRRCCGFVPGSDVSGFESVVWSFGTDGEYGIFEVSLTLSKETGAASKLLWCSPWVLECAIEIDAST